MEFCFDVLGEVGQIATIDIGDDPVDLSIGVEVPSGPSTDAIVSADPGSIEIVDDKTPSLIVDMVCAPTSEPIACVDFIVQNFNDLIVTEWHWTWDSSILSFREVTNLAPNLRAVDFGFFGGDRMSVGWTGQLNPTTIPDGDTYFTVCYDVNLTNCPGVVSIELSDLGPVEVLNSSNAEPDLNFTGCDLEYNCPVVSELSCLGAPTLVNASGCSDSGSISQRFEGGGFPYTCQWSTPSGPTPNLPCTSPVSLDNLGAGNYSVTITDVMGASTSCGPFTITSANALTLNPTVVNANCDVNGNPTTGSITINASGGSPPYIFSGPNGQQQTHTGLAPGQYRVEVRDQLGCSEFMFVTVGDDCPAAVLDCTVVGTNGQCGRGGTISTSYTGGTQPVQFFFNPAITDLNNVPTNITYTVTCRDARGMEDVTSVFIGENAARGPVINTSNIMPPPDCNGTGGTIDIDIDPGDCEPVSCEIREIVNGECLGAIPCPLNGSVTLFPGRYKIIATPSFGQPVQREFVIPDPVVDALIGRPSEVEPAGPCAANQGLGRVDVMGGCEPITVTYNDGSGPLAVLPNNNFFIPAGTYEVVVTDALGTVHRSTLFINGATEILTITPDTLNALGDCKAGVLVDGGIPDYGLVWLDETGDTLPTTDFEIMIMNDMMTDLDAAYTAIVTDNAGCTSVTSVNVFCPGMDTPIMTCDTASVPDLSLTQLTGGMASCAGVTDCDGTVSGVITAACPNVSGAPYTVTAVNSLGESFRILVDEPGAWAITGLCEEVYSIVVDDSTGSTIVAGINLEVTAPTALEISQDARTCDEPDDSTGSLLINVAGGTAPYTLAWTDESGESVDCIFECGDLEAGGYVVQVTDSNGCVLSDFFEVEPCIIPPPTECVASPVMTPNNDGANDFFFLQCAESLNGDLSVYDRWGRLIHVASPYRNDWAGTDLDGQAVLEGAYYWVFIHEDSEGGETVVKGTVTLLRDQN